METAIQLSSGSATAAAVRGDARDLASRMKEQCADLAGAISVAAALQSDDDASTHLAGLRKMSVLASGLVAQAKTCNGQLKHHFGKTDT